MTIRNSISDTPRVFAALLLGLAAASMVATFYAPDLGKSSKMLLQLSLSGENTIGAWLSSMLLLLAGLHAMDAFFTQPSHERSGSAIAWLTLGVACICLSADEAGSLHERIAIFGQNRGYEWWVTLVPFAIVLMGMLGVSLWTFIVKRKDLSSGITVLIAFGIFGLVAVQEEFEHKIQWTDSQLGLRAVVEEGSEMIAILMLLFCCMRNSGGYFSRFRREASAFGVLKQYKSYIVMLALLVAPPLIYFNIVLEDQQRGHPADWLAACLFIAASIQALRPAYERSDFSLKWTTLGLLALSASVMSMAIQIDYALDTANMAFNVKGEGISLRLVMLAVVLIGIAILASRGTTRLVSLAIAALMFGTAMSGNLVFVYTLTVVSSFLAFQLLLPGEEHQLVAPTASATKPLVSIVESSQAANADLVNAANEENRKAC